eukprot:COSAG01_NODE_10653_length_2111_cov_7.387674_1_plen_172_part_00
MRQHCGKHVGSNGHRPVWYLLWPKWYTAAFEPKCYTRPVLRNELRTPRQVPVKPSRSTMGIRCGVAHPRSSDERSASCPSTRMMYSRAWWAGTGSPKLISFLNITLYVPPCTLRTIPPYAAHNPPSHDISQRMSRAQERKAQDPQGEPHSQPAAHAGSALTPPITPPVMEG